MQTTTAVQQRRSSPTHPTHPYAFPGGSPLLRAATGRTAADRRAAWQGALLALCLTAILLISGCATSPERNTTGANAFNPTFDARWMSITVVDDRTVAQFCQHTVARDGCAKTFADAGAAPPHPTDPTAVPRGRRCNIFLNSRLLPETSIAWRTMLAHEVRHCRGWHHDGE